MWVWDKFAQWRENLFVFLAMTARRYVLNAWQIFGTIVMPNISLTTPRKLSL